MVWKQKHYNLFGVMLLPTWGMYNKFNIQSILALLWSPPTPEENMFWYLLNQTVYMVCECKYTVNGPFHICFLILDLPKMCKCKCQLLVQPALTRITWSAYSMSVPVYVWRWSGSVHKVAIQAVEHAKHFNDHSNVHCCRPLQGTFTQTGEKS